MKKYRKAIRVLMVFVVGIIVIITLLNLKANNQKRRITNSGDIKIICNKDKEEQYVTINIEKGVEFAGLSTGIIKFAVTPQYAIWIEDIEGNYLETLYVTEKISKIKRKSALPVYMKILSNEGIEVDDISGASITSSIKTNPISVDGIDRKKFKIFMEVNNSYDYNDVYKENLAIGDKGYNTDYCGQPAVIYYAEVDLDKNNTYTLEPIGHSDPTGESANIIYELDSIEGALNIVKKVDIEFYKRGK
ncbi:hypothetical protein [Vallitalea maricola]|uniref:Uncharacterized protein n=1 Tax=Vallitalea maricola TaxID=3074433 RepID=A0ACB5UKN2_9FIRM|nr:hypothetical protein AN2V17_23430 [Vallitalea sp. AN17-2]